MQRIAMQIVIIGVLCFLTASAQASVPRSWQVDSADDGGWSPQTVAAPDATDGRVLTIPALEIRSDITQFPLDGVSWAISPWERLAGHFEGTAWVNMRGNVVIGAHSEYPSGNAGLFYDLHKLNIGDTIFVQDGDLTRRYVVINVRTVDYRDVSVVYPTTHNRLTLITCDIPSYVAEQNLYYERLVVIAYEVPL